MHADVKWMRFRSCVGRVGQGGNLRHRFRCNELTVVWRAHELPRAVAALEPIHKLVPWQIVRPSQSCAGFAPVKCLVSVGGHQFLVICAVPEGRPNGRRPTVVEPPLVMFAAYCRLQQLESEYETLKENDPAELQKVVNLTQVRTDTLRATHPFSIFYLFMLPINVWCPGVSSQTAPKVAVGEAAITLWRFHTVLRCIIDFEFIGPLWCTGVQGRRKPLDGQHMVYQELDGEEEGPERERSGQVLANQERL